MGIKCLQVYIVDRTIIQSRLDHPTCMIYTVVTRHSQSFHINHSAYIASFPALRFLYMSTLQ